MTEKKEEQAEKNLEKEIRKESVIETQRKCRPLGGYLSLILVVFFVVSSFFVGYSKGQQDYLGQEKSVPINEAVIENQLPSPDKRVDFALFWKVWDILKEKHIDRDNLDAQKLIYGAISGMLKASGDPYTDFFDPEQSKSFAQDIEGSFEGIGAELGIKDSILTVIAPLDGSPAQKAGLRSGDKILKINDEIAADLTIDQAVRLIRGEKGTEVRLTVLHEGEQETQEVTVTRANIEIKNIKLEFLDDGIAHIKLVKFSDNVDTEFALAAKEILARGSRGIVLDMRDNPGGLLDKSIDIASFLIPKGEVVVTEEDSSGNRESLITSGGDKLSSLPIVVLINEGSASASEILAGALRDNRSTPIVGKKSFGKGSVQQLVNLKGGSSVKITIAKWMTPNGNYIMDTGINPDHEVDLTREDYENERDPQLEKALGVLKEKME
jgi:carboxyl-terminal processing protease